MHVKTTAILSGLVLFAVIMAGIVSAATVSEPTVTKTVTPTDINIAGSGVNEELTVTLSVTGAGDEWTKQPYQ